MDLKGRINATKELFENYSELVRDEAYDTGRIIYQGQIFGPSVNHKEKSTEISGFNYIAVWKFLDIVPDSFDKEINVIDVPGLRVGDSIKRQVAIVRTPSGKFEVDPTIEEFFVDRSQDIDLSGTTIPRVYGPRDVYPFKILPNPRVFAYQR